MLKRLVPRSVESKFYCQKLAPKWTGPFIITDIDGIVVQLQNLHDKNLEKFTSHISNLKPYNFEDCKGNTSSSVALLPRNTNSSITATSPAQLDLADYNADDAPCAHPQSARPLDDVLTWVQCDGPCDGWFHCQCLGVKESALPQMEDYVCPFCLNNSN